jgi:hypothetical protein
VEGFHHIAPAFVGNQAMSHAARTAVRIEELFMGTSKPSGTRTG